MTNKSEVQSNNIRILNNTLLLYIRMAFTMLIGFFTTRELLIALGVVDFGLVNLVGSFVTMFSFLSGAMQSTVSRYFSIEIGRKDFRALHKTFNLTLIIYAVIILLNIALLQVIYFWFLDNGLVIEVSRKKAVYDFFQFCAVGFIFNIASIPYTALLISHENIKAYSLITIVESISRLTIVYLLYLDNFDRLSYYGGMLAVISICIFITNFIYSFCVYRESRLKFYWDLKALIEMLKFAAWNLWGALSGLFSNVFINILMNNYFGPAVIAARAIALQGATGVSNFVINFLIAAKPQVVKYYAEGNHAHATNLTITISKIGYFLLFFFALPVFFEMSFVLNLWLADVPEFTVLFMRLILIQRLIDTLASPLVNLSHATGRVAIYQTIVGLLQWTVFPLSWISLKLGGDPSSVFWIGILLSIFSLVAQFYLIDRIVESFSIELFLKNAVIPVILVTVISILPTTFAYFALENSVIRFFVVTIVAILSTLATVFVIGLNNSERAAFRLHISRKVLLK